MVRRAPTSGDRGDDALALGAQPAPLPAHRGKHLVAEVAAVQGRAWSGFGFGLGLGLGLG